MRRWDTSGVRLVTIAFRDRPGRRGRAFPMLTLIDEHTRSENGSEFTAKAIPRLA